LKIENQKKDLKEIERLEEEIVVHNDEINFIIEESKKDDQS
jgi:hypothetical protein